MGLSACSGSNRPSSTGFCTRVGDSRCRNPNSPSRIFGRGISGLTPSIMDAVSSLFRRENAWVRVDDKPLEG